jgi:hypothetical protein
MFDPTKLNISTYEFEKETVMKMVVVGGTGLIQSKLVNKTSRAIGEIGRLSASSGVTASGIIDQTEASFRPMPT